MNKSMQQSPNKPKAILFDWDGTLVDSFDFLAAAHAHTCRELQRPIITPEMFKEYFGKPREFLYKELYGAENIEAAKSIFEAYVIARHMIDLKQMEGAHGLVKSLHGLGMACGIISNKKGALITEEVSSYGWDKYIDVIVGAGEAENDKPSGAPLLLGAEKIDESLKPEECFYVGDTDNDLAAAQDAGMIAILIGQGDKAEKLNIEYKPQHFFKNCTEFHQFLLHSFEKLS